MKKLAAVLAVCALFGAGCGDDDDNVTTPAADDFATLDATGDSYLDADEIGEWVDESGEFETWDADVDSELDKDEIAGNAFKLWDADRNGSISEKEWKDGTDLWYPNAVQHVTYGDWDGDGDSELDADEFAERFDLSALGEGWRVETFDEETFKQAYFELYDMDDDGRVSRNEWTRGSSVFGHADLGSEALPCGSCSGSYSLSCSWRRRSSMDGATGAGAVHRAVIRADVRSRTTTSHRGVRSQISYGSGSSLPSPLL